MIGTAVCVISIESSNSSWISSSYVSDMDPLCLLPISWTQFEEGVTHLTRTNSSSPASLLYSGKVFTLLPLSVLLNALPLDRLARLPFPAPFPTTAADPPVRLDLDPALARSSALSETRDAT